MDQLKDSVSLRGYGQRDPLQEYKKESFKLFTDMIARIEDETCLTLNRMPAPRISEQQAAEIKENLEEKDKQTTNLKFDHPSTDSTTSKSPTSPSSSLHQESSLEPFQREGEKTGRNDPCPCGSGKKYKKCHGKGA